MTTPHDGGPASEKTLRDYFMAHAPSVPTSFVVHFFNLPDDLPEVPLSWSATLAAEKADTVKARWNRLPWSEKRRCELAWPRAWADAMLAEQEKQE